jgi:hypothetical protein
MDRGAGGEAVNVLARLIGQALLGLTILLALLATFT